MRPVRLSPSHLLIALSSVLTGCSGASTPAGTPPSSTTSAPTAVATAAPLPDPACVLSGVVSGASGWPVPGALVAAIAPGGTEAVEVAHGDDKGRYCFKSLTAGKYGFTMTAPKQTAEYIDVRDFDPSAKTTLDIPLFIPAGHVLSGRVTDEKGAPMAGLRVYISRESDYMADLFVTETGPDGRYAVMLGWNKHYTPMVQLEDFAASVPSVDLKQDTTVDIKLERINPKKRPAPDEIVAWVKQKATVLRTPEAGNGFDDMEPIRAIVGDARLVGLGEATHGTREFFQLKHRMLEFLVTRMGFRSFGIEASFGDCLPLSEYVRTGKGDPAAALANQGFWTWDTEEVLALVKWMRAYNADASHKKKISFWGYDMQSPASSTQALIAYLGKVDRSVVKEYSESLELIDDDFSARNLELRPSADLDAASAAVKKLSAFLQDHKDDFVKKTSARDHALAMIHARVLRDYLGAFTRHDHGLRDESMAEIASALLDVEDLESPGAKMAIWAHNGHIHRTDSQVKGPMGSHLAKRFGKAYVPFGFAFDEGSFQAVDMGKEHRGLMSFTLPAAPPGSFDHTLSRAGIPLFALDLRAAPAGPVAEYLARPSFSRSIGALFSEDIPEYGLEMDTMSASFDAMLFVQKTTTARGNNTGKRSPRDRNKPEIRELTDPGFEAEKAGEAVSFGKLTPYPRQLEYKATVSKSKCASGKQCLALERTKGDVATGEARWATAIDATSFRGRTARFSASARVEGKGIGDEGFLFIATGDQATAWSAIPGSAWGKVIVDIDVPPDAKQIFFGLAVTGKAKGALDDIEVTPRTRGVK